MDGGGCGKHTLSSGGTNVAADADVNCDGYPTPTVDTLCLRRQTVVQVRCLSRWMYPTSARSTSYTVADSLPARRRCIINYTANMNTTVQTYQSVMDVSDPFAFAASTTIMWCVDRPCPPVYPYGHLKRCFEHGRMHWQSGGKTFNASNSFNYLAI